MAHVAYPDHWNTGDPAIWLGEKAALERLGIHVAYECKWQEYNRDVLNRLLGSCNNHDLLVTTEKDAVKLSAADFPIPCYQTGVELVFDDISPLAALLEEVLAQCR